MDDILLNLSFKSVHDTVSNGLWASVNHAVHENSTAINQQRKARYILPREFESLEEANTLFLCRFWFHWWNHFAAFIKLGLNISYSSEIVSRFFSFVYNFFILILLLLENRFSTGSMKQSGLFNRSSLSSFDWASDVFWVRSQDKNDQNSCSKDIPSWDKHYFILSMKYNLNDASLGMFAYPDILLVPKNNTKLLSHDISNIRAGWPNRKY